MGICDAIPDEDKDTVKRDLDLMQADVPKWEDHKAAHDRPTDAVLDFTYGHAGYYSTDHIADAGFGEVSVEKPGGEHTDRQCNGSNGDDCNSHQVRQPCGIYVTGCPKGLRKFSDEEPNRANNDVQNQMHSRRIGRWIGTPESA